MAILLKGTTARDAHIKVLIEKVSKLSFKPTLVILQVGARPDSDAYIRQKKLLAEKIGARIIHIQFPESISQAEIKAEIENTIKILRFMASLYKFLCPHIYIRQS